MNMNKNTGHRWTDDEISYLAAHYKPECKAKSIEDLAEHFGVSTTAIKNKITRLQAKGTISQKEEVKGKENKFRRSAILALPQKVKDMIVKRKDFDGTGIPALLDQYKKDLAFNTT